MISPLILTLLAGPAAHADVACSEPFPSVIPGQDELAPRNAKLTILSDTAWDCGISSEFEIEVTDPDEAVILRVDEPLAEMFSQHDMELEPGVTYTVTRRWVDGGQVLQEDVWTFEVEDRLADEVAAPAINSLQFDHYRDAGRHHFSFSPVMDGPSLTRTDDVLILLEEKVSGDFYAASNTTHSDVHRGELFFVAGRPVAYDDLPEEVCVTPRQVNLAGEVAVGPEICEPVNGENDTSNGCGGCSAPSSAPAAALAVLPLLALVRRRRKAQ